MSDAFTDLRNAIRRRHDRLKRQIKSCRDPATIAILKAQKKEVWHVWNAFLFEDSTVPVRHSADVPPGT